MPATFFVLCVAALGVLGASSPPSSSPHDYPGKPTGALSPQWQSYYEVKEPFPNVTFPLTRSFAGNIPVGRNGHPNTTLFFWAFEKSNGSLTDESSTEPWAIWLNGGPGSSSLIGMLFENGPIRINPDYSLSPNPHSWNNVADYFWLDQPAGVGFGTSDADGYVADEPGMAEDFISFLGNLVKVFPALAKRPLYLTGESYAGMYIPYIMKAYTGLAQPPVKIAKIAIGDGSIGTWQAYNFVPAVSVLRTFPQIIGYDKEVFEYFQEQEHLCGYDLNLTYPSTEPLPDIAWIEPTARPLAQLLKARRGQASRFQLMRQMRLSLPSQTIRNRGDISRIAKSRRDLSGRTRGQIDPWYGCFLFDEYVDYAVNFTFPWNSEPDAPPPLGNFDVYNIPDALWPSSFQDASVFLNDNRTRRALHAPINKDWTPSFEFVFGENGGYDISVEPIAFLSNLATNLTAHNISVILYSGNNDALIPHYGTEVTIQNTTFGGIRGFTRKPATPWTTEDGQFAGIIHQERGWTYALFDNAGHLVPTQKPVAALHFIREFLFGSNPLGTVLPDGSVVGGEDPKLASGIIEGPPGIYTGPGVTQSTYVFPQATRAAWSDYAAKAFAVQPEKTNGASGTPAIGITMGTGLAGVLLLMGL